MKYLKHIIVLLFVVIPLEIVGMIILPFVLLFVGKDKEQLPSLFRWFDNHETHLGVNGADDGLAGPPGYRLENGIYPYGEYNFFKNLWHRYYWLALRNPIYYFSYVVLGVNLSTLTEITSKEGDFGIGDKYRAGSYYLEVAVNGKSYFEYYLVYKYPLKKDKCFRFRIGWKLTSEDSHKQWVFTVTPWMNYTGE